MSRDDIMKELAEKRALLDKLDKLYEALEPVAKVLEPLQTGSQKKLCSEAQELLESFLKKSGYTVKVEVYSSNEE